MSGLDLTRAVWRKSTRSNGGGGACVEVAFAPGVAALRDSKNPADGTLVLPAAGWSAFRSAVTAG